MQEDSASRRGQQREVQEDSASRAGQQREGYRRMGRVTGGWGERKRMVIFQFQTRNMQSDCMCMKRHLCRALNMHVMMIHRLAPAMLSFWKT